jgi:hypothetical protein
MKCDAEHRELLESGANGSGTDGAVRRVVETTGLMLSSGVTA